MTLVVFLFDGMSKHVLFASVMSAVLSWSFVHTGLSLTIYLMFIVFFSAYRLLIHSVLIASVQYDLVRKRKGWFLQV